MAHGLIKSCIPLGPMAHIPPEDLREAQWTSAPCGHGVLHEAPHGSCPLRHIYGFTCGATPWSNGPIWSLSSHLYSALEVTNPGPHGPHGSHILPMSIPRRLSSGHFSHIEGPTRSLERTPDLCPLWLWAPPYPMSPSGP